MASSSSLSSLESLLHSGRSTADPEYRTVLARLGAELTTRFIRDPSSHDAFEYFSGALRALVRLRGSSNGQDRAEALFECYRFFYLNGRRSLALSAAQAMRDAARHLANSYLFCKAEMLVGIIHSEDHRVGDALLSYSQSIEIAERDGHMPSLAAGWLNLGNALNYGSLYADAIPCFRRALHIAETHREAHPIIKAPALCNLAQSYYHLEEYEAGYEAIGECLAESAAPKDPHEFMQRTIREMTFVLLSSTLRMKEEALLHLGFCNEYAQRLGAARATFIAKLASGIYHVRFGEVSRGLEILKSCIDSSMAEVPLLRADALEMLVLAHDEAGQAQEALCYLRELIEQIRLSRKESILQLSSLGFQPHRSAWGASRDLRGLESIENKIAVRIAQEDALQARIELLERLAIAADLKEETSGEHGYRVGSICALLAKELGWTSGEVFDIEIGGRLHDLGKTAVPDRILMSNQLLREAERQFVCAHTVVGAEMLSGSASPQLKQAEIIARCHHEWWNGEGYPSKLSGNRIPIHARIVALADVFDALTHGRPYAPAWPVEQALAEIRSRRGTQFDPELTDLFLNLMERLINEHEDLDAYLGRASRHSPFLQARNKIRQMLEAERENEKRATVDGNQTRH